MTRNVAQYPQHYVTYLGTMFKVAMSNGLGGDAFTRNLTDAQPDRRKTDRLSYEINIPFFSKEKRDIINREHRKTSGEEGGGGGDKPIYFRGTREQTASLGLNEIYVWFLLHTNKI